MKIQNYIRTCCVAIASAVAMTSLWKLEPTYAQSVCLPLPRLLTSMPMGGPVGTEIEVTISGENIEDTTDLLFSHPGLTARPKQNGQGQIEPNRFVVNIAADCPTGIHEARVMTRLGISSPRVFCVDTLPEVIVDKPNTTLQNAFHLLPNSICNAVMTVKAVDHFTFDAKQGQRYLLHCAAQGIDSKLNAVMIVADEAGRDLVVERRGGMLDFTAQVDGKHVIKIHELTFQGGPHFYYRLSLRELGTSDPIPEFPSTKAVQSFSWPPTGLTETASLSEVEPNHLPDQIQKITLPCDIAGSFFPAADVDVFEFGARKGEIWWVEIASQRIGRPTDPNAIVQRVVRQGDQVQLVDVIEFTDIPSPMKPSSNGYAYDGPPYDGGSVDFIGKLEIPEDGEYRIQMSDLFGGTRNDDRNIYRLIVRQATPDFALASWGMHMELRNGDRNALSKPIALRAGSTMALEVVVVRRDGFDGPIELMMSDLPPGVQAQGLKIPPGQNRGIMLVTAAQDAADCFAKVQFTGQATINGQVVTHPVQMASMAWPVPDAWNEIPIPRLVQDIPVSVTTSEAAPLTIAASERKTWEVVAGQTLTIPLVHTRRSAFSGNTLQLKTLGQGFENVPRFDVAIDAETSQAVLDLAALGNPPPGDYLIAFYGPAVVSYRFNPGAIAIQEIALQKAKDEAVRLATEVEAAQQAAQNTTSEPESNNTAEQLATQLATLMQQKTAADAVVVAAEAKLKSLTDMAAPRDTAEIIISEPIAIRVLPAEAK